MSFMEYLNLKEIEEKEKKEEILLAKKIADDSSQLKDIMNDLNNIIKDSDIQLIDINDKLQESQVILDETKGDLIEAEKLKNNNSLLKVTGFSTILGLCIGGPLGFLGGSYLGLALGGGLIGTIAGGSIGGGTAYSLHKNKKKNTKKLKKE